MAWQPTPLTTTKIPNCNTFIQLVSLLFFFHKLHRYIHIYIYMCMSLCLLPMPNPRTHLFVGAPTRHGIVGHGLSSSTGIALAAICAERGYRCVIVMPDDQSPEKRKLLERFGAEVTARTAKLVVGRPLPPQPKLEADLSPPPLCPPLDPLRSKSFASLRSQAPPTTSTSPAAVPRS